MGRKSFHRKSSLSSRLWAFAILFCAASATCLAQAPAIQWQKAIPVADHGEANAICGTTDGGYIVAGTVDTPGIDTKIRLIKLNAAGAELWRKDYGSPYPDEVQHIEQTADGGFVLSASVSINGGDVTGHHGQYDFWLMKTDAAGQLQWQRSYGGSGQEAWGHATQTPDGGFIFCAGTQSINGDITGKQNGTSMDGLVMKLSSTGAIQWQKTYGGSGEDLFRTIITAPGGYYVCGWSGSGDGIVPANNGSTDAWIVKLDLSGNIIWQQTFGGTHTDIGNSIALMADGGCVATGFTKSINLDFTGNHGAMGVTDGWVIRLDAGGGTQWKRVLGGTGNDGFDCIVATTDGGATVLGRSQTADGDVATNLGADDLWLVHLAAGGNILWQKALGGTHADGQNVFGKAGLIETTDRGIAIASATTSAGIPGILNPGQNLNSWYVAKIESPCDTVTAVHDSVVCISEMGQVALGMTLPALPPYQWGTGAATATIQVSDTGTYWRTAGNACHLRIDTFRLQHRIRTVAFPHDTTVCTGTTLQLGSADGFLQYRWSNGDTVAVLNATRPGLFIRTAVDLCRSQTDSFIVRQVPALRPVELGPAVAACFDNAPPLGQEQPGAQYRWSTGETTAFIKPKYSGTYVVEVSNGCEKEGDSVAVSLVDCGACFSIPNAFSPNGDGRNDLFGPMVRCAVSGYRLEIFNRWGQCLFIASRPEQRWDGTFNGQPADAGTYFYSLSALAPDGHPVMLRGDVMVVR